MISAGASMAKGTMVERVARALCKAAGHDPDGPTNDVLVHGDPDSIYPWAGFRREARVAIEAMREPTADMVDAGRDVGPDAPYGVSETADRWTTMIDAALTERQ